MKGTPRAADGSCAWRGPGGHHIQGGEQRRRSMALVLMGDSTDSTAIGKAQISLGALEGLNMGLFVDTDHHGILGWMKIESHNVGSLLSKLRVGTDAPT